VDRGGLDVLVPRQRIDLGAVLEQHVRRVDVPEEARKPEWVEAVGAEGVLERRIVVHELPDPRRAVSPSAAASKTSSGAPRASSRAVAASPR
jgi:hypothetical protein